MKNAPILSSCRTHLKVNNWRLTCDRRSDRKHIEFKKLYNSKIYKGYNLCLGVRQVLSKILRKNHFPNPSVYA